MGSTSTISSLGVGSGLDAEGIVTKLVALERQPIAELKTAETKLQTKISSYGQIQSNVSAVRDAAQKLANPSIWGSTKTTSSDPSAVNLSTSDGAAIGNYAISVTSLAASQSVLCKTVLSSVKDTIGAGLLTIDKGQWTAEGFAAPADAQSVSVSIDSTDTLERIRDKINSSGAGVQASIVNDASGARLVMKSTETGIKNGFRIRATEFPSEVPAPVGLSELAFDPASGTTGTALTQAASDSAATINGVAVSSTSNTYSDVMSGITMNVSKVTSAPVNVSVDQDNDTITKAVSDFATSYSTLATFLATNTKYEEGSKTPAPLQGDSLAISTINQFRALLGTSTTASAKFPNLSAVGLEMQRGGTLTVNSTKLNSALGDVTEVKKFFANVGTAEAGNQGMAVQVRDLADNLTGFDGAITSRTSGLNKTIQDNHKRQDTMDARANLYEKRLRAQYAALDKNMAAISKDSGYVTQMTKQSKD